MWYNSKLPYVLPCISGSTGWIFFEQSSYESERVWVCNASNNRIGQTIVHINLLFIIIHNIKPFWKARYLRYYPPFVEFELSIALESMLDNFPVSKEAGISSVFASWIKVTRLSRKMLELNWPFSLEENLYTASGAFCCNTIFRKRSCVFRAVRFSVQN